MKGAKKYNLAIGSVVSLFIALMASVPRLLKTDDIEPETFIINIIYTLSLAMSCWTIHHYVVYSRFRPSFINNTWLKYPLSIAAGVAFTILYHELVNMIIDTSPALLENVAQERRIFTMIFRGILVSGFMFFVTYYLYVLSITQQSMMENERLKKEKLHARLESLKQQISPHFLFNTLNTLSTLTKEERVKEYISETSNVYRYLLQYKDRDLVRLSDELKFIDSYLYILRERFESGLAVDLRINGQTLNSMLPPLALQTLVENAVKHNVVSSSRPLHIEIFYEDSFIVVSNNLQPRQSVGHESSNSGLSNINERYRLIANKEIVIIRTERDFTVKLPIVVC